MGKTIYQGLSKELLYHSKKTDNPYVPILGPAVISAVNIDGATIYSGLGINGGVKLLGFNDKMKVSLRKKLLEVKMVIIDKFSMVLRDLFFKINGCFIEVFLCCFAIEFVD